MDFEWWADTHRSGRGRPHAKVVGADLRDRRGDMAHVIPTRVGMTLAGLCSCSSRIAPVVAAREPRRARAVSCRSSSSRSIAGEAGDARSGQLGDVLRASQQPRPSTSSQVPHPISLPYRCARGALPPRLEPP